MTTTEERIEQTIINFVKGGDEADVALLDTVLHQDFRVSSSAFMGTNRVAIIDKEQYLANISSGVFGGLPRHMNIESIDCSGSIAMVKLKLESAENHFVSYNALVLDSDKEWKIIHNLAVVSSKK